MQGENLLHIQWKQNFHTNLIFLCGLPKGHGHSGLFSIYGTLGAQSCNLFYADDTQLDNQG